MYPVAQPDLDGNENEYVAAAIRTGEISSIGRHVKAFESSCAEVLEAAHAVTTSSGTSALHLALCALDIGPGDEVIVPDLGYVATANTVRYTGAKVVLVDVDPATWTMDPRRVAHALTRRTKAVVAVHLYGNPADMDALCEITRGSGTKLIEDAAQAFGARWNHRCVGTIGDVGCFSFFGNKIVTTGEGGLVVARSPRLAARLAHLRDQARSTTRRYFHTELAFNYRMTALQAAVGLAQLERLPHFLEQRSRIRDWYRFHLRRIPDLIEPATLEAAQPVTWLHTFRVRGWTRRQRDRSMDLLRQRGIDSRPVFVPMSRLPMYRGRGHRVAEDLSATGLSLPTYTRMTESDVSTVAAAFEDVWRQVGDFDELSSMERRASAV